MPQKPCELWGCPQNRLDAKNVCTAFRSKSTRTHGDWQACPYQMPGNWRWQPTFDASDNTLKCEPPAKGTKGYDTEMRYDADEWQTCKRETPAGH